MKRLTSLSLVLGVAALATGVTVALHAQELPWAAAPAQSAGRYQLVQHWPAASRYLHVYLLDTVTGSIWMPVQERTGEVRWLPMRRVSPDAGAEAWANLGDALPLSGLPEEGEEGDSEDPGVDGWIAAATRSLPGWVRDGPLGDCVRQCMLGEGPEPLDLK